MADMPAPIADIGYQPEKQPPPAAPAETAPAKAPEESAPIQPAEAVAPQLPPVEAADGMKPIAPLTEPAPPTTKADAPNGDKSAETPPSAPPIMSSALPVPTNGEAPKARPTSSEPAKDDFVRDVPPQAVDGNATGQGFSSETDGTRTVPTTAPPPAAPDTEVQAKSAVDVEMTDAPAPAAETAPDPPVEPAPVPAPPAPTPVAAESVAQPVVGEKRKAEEPLAANGEEKKDEPAAVSQEEKPAAVEEPATKKLKTDEPTAVSAPATSDADSMAPPPSAQPEAPAVEAPATNGGGVKKSNSKTKREKKPVAPVGKTARRTRSQALRDQQ